MDKVIELEEAGLTLDGGAGPVEILTGVSLAVERGTSLGLIGPSGSGKSSLLMLLGGLERASAGRVSVMGHDLTRLGEDALARFRREHMGVVFQSFHLIPTMTAVENAATPLELRGASDAFDRAGAALDAVGLGARRGHYPDQLSGGEQQRVALARAMVGQPDILLADEPTGNLDRTTGAEVLDLMFAAQAKSRATMVLVTHDPALAGRCDRVLALSDGRLDAGGSAQVAE